MVRRHGGDRGCGGHNGQGVMVRRHGGDRGCGGHNGQGVMVRRHGGDRGCGGHNGQGVMVRRHGGDRDLWYRMQWTQSVMAMMILMKNKIKLIDTNHDRQVEGEFAG